MDGLALVDTGAAATGIDREAAMRIGLPVVDTTKVTSATHSDEIVPVFAASVQFPTPEAVAFPVINCSRAAGLNLKPLGLLAIVGRDVLRECLLTYDGKSALFNLKLLIPNPGE